MSTLTAESTAEEPFILVAEDHPITQRQTLKTLKRFGFTAVLAPDGEKAVKLWQATDFDLVLMDLQMPKKTGIEATKDIRDTGSKSPVIAYTADVPQGIYFAFPLNHKAKEQVSKLDGKTKAKIVELAEAHFNAVLGKPASPQLLANTIYKTLGGTFKEAGVSSSQPGSPRPASQKDGRRASSKTPPIASLDDLTALDLEERKKQHRADLQALKVRLRGCDDGGGPAQRKEEPKTSTASPL